MHRNGLYHDCNQFVAQPNVLIRGDVTRSDVNVNYPYGEIAEGSGLNTRVAR